MITALRHLFVDSWLGRLMALLTFFAFVVWGGNSIFNLSAGNDSDVLISVGKESIPAPAFERLLGIRQRILADKFQDAKWVYDQQTVSQLAQTTLGTMINSLAAMQAAKAAGFVISDSQIRARVFSDPQFKGADGNFDPKRMNMLLQANGQNREDLIEQVCQHFYETAVLQDLGSSVQSSRAAADYLSRYFGNTYQIEAVRLPEKQPASILAQPKEAQLKRFYLNHAALFRLPEYRHITVAILTKEGVAASVEVPEKTLRHLYEQRQHIYKVPQTRDVNILTFKELKQANTCKTHWQEGLAWQKLAEKCAESIPASLEKARKTDIPSDNLAQAVFSAKAGALKGPVALDGQFALILVDKIYPPKDRSFEEVRPEILKEIQAAGVSEAFHQKLGAFEEAVAGTGSLDKLPSKLGAEIFSATLDEKGKTPADREVIIPGGARLQREILREAFRRKKGDLPQIIHNEDQAYALSVDERSPARLQAFQDVKAEVLQKWREDLALYHSEAQATDLLEYAKTHSLKQGLDYFEIKEGDYSHNIQVSRMKKTQNIPEFLANRVLSANSEKAVMVQDGKRFWIAKITEITPLASAEMTKMSEDLQKKTTSSLRGDIIENLERSYVGKYQTKNFNIKRYQEIIAHFVR